MPSNGADPRCRTNFQASEVAALLVSGARMMLPTLRCQDSPHIEVRPKLPRNSTSLFIKTEGLSRNVGFGGLGRTARGQLHSCGGHELERHQGWEAQAVTRLVG